MVELELDDYRTILEWFEMAMGRLPAEKITLKDRKAFWKISFFIEDKIRELKERAGD